MSEHYYKAKMTIKVHQVAKALMDSDDRRLITVRLFIIARFTLLYPLGFRC